MLIARQNYKVKENKGIIIIALQSTVKNTNFSIYIFLNEHRTNKKEISSPKKFSSMLSIIDAIDRKYDPLCGRHVEVFFY